MICLFISLLYTIKVFVQFQLSVYIAPAELMDIHLCGSIRPCTLVLEPRQTEEIAITFKSDSGGTSKGFNLTCKAIKISKD